MNAAPPPRPSYTPSPRPSHNPQPEPQPAQKRAFADALTRNAGKTKKQTADDNVFAALAMPRDLAAAPMAEGPATAGDVDAMLHAHLDRIAAAIAEIAKGGAEPQVQLSLPLGAYRIEGAVLGRDLAGQINVLLIPATAVPPAMAAQWSEQLNERLLRREIRVGRVGVQAPSRRAFPPA
jgi:hypothetical protein